MGNQFSTSEYSLGENEHDCHICAGFGGQHFGCEVADRVVAFHVAGVASEREAGLGDGLERSGPIEPAEGVAGTVIGPPF